MVARPYRFGRAQSDGIAQEPATALLIVDLDKHIGNARAWCDTFGEQLPDLEIRISPDAGNLADIEYLAFMHPDFDSLPVFPNLKPCSAALLGSSPFTRETEGIFCARTFAMMPRGAMPVNVGRGKHVVDEDLIKALDSGQLSYAALDALCPEPLPSGKPSGAPDRIGHAYQSRS